MTACDYANARIGALRARLLGEKGLREMAARPGLEARVAGLLESDWRDAVAPRLARQPDRLQAVEEGLADRLQTSAARIERWLGPAARALLRALFLLDDAAAVKAVLRGLLAGLPAERSAAGAAPTPALPASALRELAALPSPAAVAAALVARRHPLGTPLARALEGAPGPGLVRLEVALDRAAIAAACARAAGRGEGARLVRAQVGARADHANVTTLLALDRGASPDFFVEGGRLGPAGFAALAALDPGRRRERLAAFLGPVRGRRRARPEDLASPERAALLLASALERDLHGAARRSPLSVAVPVAYLARQRGEARRIRLVLRGAEYGLPPDELLDLLEA